jgi:UDP-3-O-[3-hydroxymyristoyl] glucosamine N-acyltransferase
MKKLTLEQVAQITSGELHGDANAVVSKIAAMDTASSGDLTFLSNTRYKKHLASCNATAVMVKESEKSLATGNVIVVSDPYVAYAKVAQAMDTTPKAATGIAETAVIPGSVRLGKNISIGANAVIEEGVELEDGVVIGANCFIGKNSRIGANTQLWANVTVYHNVEIGHSCLVQSGTIIGSDGFGYANDKGEWQKIPQTGGVKIGDRVEIGAGTTIDRGALDDTIIESNVILDNQLQISHNVHIGYGTCIAGASIIAGSTQIGKYCIIGGGACLAGHITIADGVSITGMAMITKGISEKGVYSSGIPARDNRSWRRMVARVNRLEDTENKIKEIEKKLEV